MSTQNQERRLNVRDVAGMKGSRPIVSLTAYSAPMARALDAHADLILVGDSLGMVLYGMDTTVGVSLNMMVAHGAAVVGATARACVIVDLPFGSYQESPQAAFRAAARVMVVRVRRFLAAAFGAPASRRMTPGLDPASV